MADWELLRDRHQNCCGEEDKAAALPAGWQVQVKTNDDEEESSGAACVI